MKTAVCCIIKDENAYLREFVEWYKNLGFDNIILYDNNDSDGENIHNSIGDYIESGYVKVVNIKDKKVMQLPAFNDCISRFGPVYDWIAFFDCDEHLQLKKEKSISDFLSTFDDDVDSVVVNWMIMDDNDMLDNDGRPLEERFTRIASKEYNQYTNVKENQHIKTILRCTENNIKIVRFPNPHFVIGLKRSVNANGDNVRIGCWCTEEPDFSRAFLKHFQMKTITEFLNNRMLKGAPDINYNWVINNRHTVDKFFNLNERTPEKEAIAKKFFNENQDKINERKKRG